MFRIPTTELPPHERSDPADLVPLAELAAEGFGYGSPYVTTPRDAIDVLAVHLGDRVILDDLGRRCVGRDMARELFAERAEAEARRQQVQERREAQLAEQAASNVPRGIPAERIPDGVTPAAAMLQAARDSEPRRRSVLESALSNDESLTFHRIREEDEE